MVVYELEEGVWRGFAHPYGETIEASSKEEALDALRELTQAYFNSAKKYGYPSHLVNGTLSNLIDRKVLNWVVSNKDFMKGIHSQVGKVDFDFCYAEAFRVKS